MLIIAKTFATIFALLVIARSIVDYKNKKESLTMTIFWIILWFAIIILTYFPKIIDYSIRLLGGDKTGLGTIFGMAIIFVLFICYRVYVKANRIEKKVEMISRQYSLLSFELERKRKR